MRPSASTSGSGELWRSSVHSSATFLGLRRARWQSMSTGRCSAESVMAACACEVLERLAPLARAVGGQAGQLADGGHAGRLFGHRLDGPERILVAAPLVGAVGRLGLLDQALAVSAVATSAALRISAAISGGRVLRVDRVESAVVLARAARSTPLGRGSGRAARPRPRVSPGRRCPPTRRSRAVRSASTAGPGRRRGTAPFLVVGEASGALLAVGLARR